jgi:hypothetical protein
MHRPIWRLGLALAFALGIVAACDPEKPTDPDPELFLTATPRQINDQGQISEIGVTATNADGTKGTGTVTLKAAAGTFSSGGTEETVTLDSAGKASASFLCNKGADSKCAGNVRIEGTWGTTTASVTVTVGSNVPSTDGGTDGGTNPKPDGGTPDGGGGSSGTFTTVVQTSKPLLVANTGDQTLVTATVTRTAGGTAVAGALVTFNTTLGSFAPGLGTQSIEANTDATGKAQVSLYVANSAPGTARITATHGDGTGIREITFSAISSIVYVTGSAKSLLGLESSGRETTSPVSFRVINSNQQAVPEVDVSFEVSGAAGASVTPTATTNAQGVATTTLRSGNSVGVAIVKATVTATKNSTPDVSANHPGTPIVGGKPSDTGLTVDCTLKNLGALHALPPPRTVTTSCKAKLVDRFSNPVGLSTPVQWYSEAGSINSPVDSRAQQGATPSSDTGDAVTVFSSNGAFPPYAVTPLPGEKYEGSATDPNGRNPRDMTVTVIAVVAGEEEFIDGSGSGPTAGQVNGRWDPGEWFTDLGEPLVDRNDNGVWDPGESFIDTERIDCANPSAPPTKNGRWDGPNGCWDSNTQIWRAIHLIYSGSLYTGARMVEDGYLVLPPNQPYSVPVNGVADVGFRWTDAYFNRMSPDGAGFAVSKTGNRGSVAVIHDASAFAYGGFTISYVKREGTTQEDGSIQLGGLCDTGKPTPPNSSTAPVATRCVRSAEFTFLPGGNTGTVRLTGATSVGAPVTSTIDLRANHSFSSSPIIQFSATYE